MIIDDTQLYMVSYFVSVLKIRNGNLYKNLYRKQSEHDGKSIFSKCIIILFQRNNVDSRRLSNFQIQRVFHVISKREGRNNFIFRRRQNIHKWRQFHTHSIIDFVSASVPDFKAKSIYDVDPTFICTVFSRFIFVGIRRINNVIIQRGHIVDK